MEKKLTIDSEFITLAQALKFLDLVSSGGQAKFFLIDNHFSLTNNLYLFFYII